VIHIQHLTESLVALQRCIDYDQEPMDVLDCVRKARWQCTLIWKEYELLAGLAAETAEIITSLPAIEPADQYVSIHRRASNNVFIMEDMIRRQAYRIRRFQSFWQVSVGGVFVGSPFDPKARMYTYGRTEASTSSEGAKDVLGPSLADPDRQEEPPDLIRFLPVVNRELNELLPLNVALSTFWEEWGTPPGGRANPVHCVIADREWLETEWVVGSQLQEVSTKLRSQYTHLHEETPGLIFPVF